MEENLGDAFEKAKENEAERAQKDEQLSRQKKREQRQEKEQQQRVLIDSAKTPNSTFGPRTDAYYETESSGV